MEHLIGPFLPIGEVNAVVFELLDRTKCCVSWLDEPGWTPHEHHGLVLDGLIAQELLMTYPEGTEQSGNLFHVPLGYITVFVPRSRCEACGVQVEILIPRQHPPKR